MVVLVGVGGQGLIYTGGQLPAGTTTATATIKTAQGIQTLPVLVPTGAQLGLSGAQVASQARVMGPPGVVLQQGANPGQFVVSQQQTQPTQVKKAVVKYLSLSSRLCF